MQSVFQRLRLGHGGAWPVLAFCLVLVTLLGRTSFAADESHPVPQVLAPKVYAFVGAASAPTPQNLGRVGNQGILVGTSGIVVIGTGGSHAQGEALLAAIGRLSDKPVVLAINAYAAPEQVLGNSAFARRGIPILAHVETDRYMVQNCAGCIRRLAEAAGEEATQGSRLERPTRLIETSTTLEIAGRRLEILHFGTSQQPGAIAVFDRESGVLFAGGLASFDVIPDAHDGELANWRRALDSLQQLPLRAVLPGRGPVGPPQRLREVADYLQGLEQQTALAYDKGVGLAGAPQAVTLPAFRHWAQYDLLHPRNVHSEYLRREARDLGQ